MAKEQSIRKSVATNVVCGDHRSRYEVSQQPPKAIGSYFGDTKLWLQVNSLEEVELHHSIADQCRVCSVNRNPSGTFAHTQKHVASCIGDWRSSSSQLRSTSIDRSHKGKSQSHWKQFWRYQTVASPGLEVNEDGKLIGIEEVSFTITSVSTESEDGKLIGIEEISFTIPSRISVYQRSIEIHQERLHIRRNMSLLVGNSSVILFLGKAMMFVNNEELCDRWSSSRFQRSRLHPKPCCVQQRRRKY
jgi:hypothetical protein